MQAPQTGKQNMKICTLDRKITQSKIYLSIQAIKQLKLQFDRKLQYQIKTNT